MRPNQDEDRNNEYATVKRAGDTPIDEFSIWGYDAFDAFDVYEPDDEEYTTTRASASFLQLRQGIKPTRRAE